MSTVFPPCATTSSSSEPSAWSKNSHTPGAIAFLPEGYRICLVFLKLFERIYAPLTAGLLHPFPDDNKLKKKHLSQLDRLYQRVANALDDLLQAVGLNAA